MEGKPDWEWEPLEAWRRYAGVALGCLHVMASLREGKSGADEDWERIIGIFESESSEGLDHDGWEDFELDEEEDAPGGNSEDVAARAEERFDVERWVAETFGPPDPLQGEKVMLPNIAQYWLTELAHVNFYFRWDWEIGVPSLKLVGQRSELFGALGLQLVLR